MSLSVAPAAAPAAQPFTRRSLDERLLQVSIRHRALHSSLLLREPELIPLDLTAVIASFSDGTATASPGHRPALATGGRFASSFARIELLTL